MITLQDADLAQVHRTYDLVRSQTPQIHKQICLGPQQEITQEFHWARQIAYRDSQDRHHMLNIVTCKESKPTRQGDPSTTTFKWLTNFIPTAHNVDTLANQAGRLRWKVENEGFNIQKNGGFNLQHPYSQNDNARKVFYYLLQIAHLLFQLLEKGSLFRQAFPQGIGSLRNIAFRLLEGVAQFAPEPQGFLCPLQRSLPDPLRYFLKQAACQPTSRALPAGLASARQDLSVKLTCRASYFILPCFLLVFSLLTSYEATPAHLGVLVSRLFLLVSSFSLSALRNFVGFLHRCTDWYCLLY